MPESCSSRRMPRQGWQGWDEYAPFYDWENARTLGRRDVPFWRRVAAEARRPRARARMRHRPRLAAAGARRRRSRRHRSVGADARPRAAAESRESPSRRARRVARVSSAATSARCRSRPRAFSMVLAPYGILQSLLARPRSRRDARRRSRACSRRGGTFGIDLVPDVPELARVREPASSCAGARPAARISRSIESVRQDPRAPPDDVRAALRRAARRPVDASIGSS